MGILYRIQGFWIVEPVSNGLEQWDTASQAHCTYGSMLAFVYTSNSVRLVRRSKASHARPKPLCAKSRYL